MSESETKFRTPFKKHLDAGHLDMPNVVSRVSFNGIDVFEECSECQLCWKLPNVMDRDQYPITINRYPMEGGKS